MRINTNVSALVASRNLQSSNDAVSRSMSKLSSGFRINNASDDAAGLGIANKIRADLRSLSQASRNAEQANSMLQVAEGGAQNIAKILDRMKELATQAASDNVDSDGRTQLNNEFGKLQSEIDRIAATTVFQGQTLLNGGFGATVNTSSTVFATTTGAYDVKLNGAATGAYTLSSGGGTVTLTGTGGTQTLGLTAATNQTLNFSKFGISVLTNNTVGAATLNATNITVGAGSGSFLVSSSGSYSSNDVITMSSVDLRASTIGIGSDSLTSLGNAQTALTNIDTALKWVNTALGNVGAAQNRIEFANASTKSSIQNLSAAESVIRDLDMAEEMTKFSKSQILSQAGTAMLAQANQLGQGVLQLLRG